MNHILAQKKDILISASLLFGLFFGAGNLIFPVGIGFGSGRESVVAMLGFILAAVGLPCLAVYACAKSGKDSLESMLEPFGKKYAIGFTAVLLLTIGPFFALPRTATVPFEVGIRSHYAQLDTSMGLFIYTSIFFLFAFLLAIKPGKLEKIIGKVINPLFLSCLFVFFIVAWMSPMGSIQTTEAQGLYAQQTFLTSLKDGYQTMDVLAALIFGFVVFHAQDEPNPKRLGKAAIVTGIVMALIYALLIIVGAQAQHLHIEATNGGVILGQIFSHYFGRLGSIFLLITITLACLKTAIGLIVSTSKFFHENFPRISYNMFAIIITVFALTASNRGLDTLITYAVPVLNFVYPLALMHVILVLLRIKDKIILKITLYFTLIAASIEVLIGLPKHMLPLQLNTFINRYVEVVPGADLGMSWLLFMIGGIFVGLLIQWITKRSD